MGFLTPLIAGIAAAITIPILVSFYFLKLRRREMAVSSTLLWRKAIQDLQVNAPFQKMRRNLLLLLQLILLALLLFAMARPTLRTAAEMGTRVVIVVDHSASMRASDAGASGTRLDRARGQARDIIDGLDATVGEGGGAMLIGFAAQAQVLQPMTSDRALLRAAVDTVRQTDQPTNLGAALRLVEPFAQRAEDAEGLIVYILSDGRTTTEQKGLTLAGADLRYLKIGNDSQPPENVALVSMAARRDFERPERVQVFARLANFGPNAVDTSVSLRVEGQVQKVSNVTVPPLQAVLASEGDPAADADAEPTEHPGSRSLQFDLVMTGSGLIELAHDHTDDLLVDNQAALVLAPARRLRVLTVGKRNAFVTRAIEAAGVRKLVHMDGQKYENQDPDTLRRVTMGIGSGVDEGYDAIVFQGYTPERLPPVASMFMNAAPPIDGLELVPAGESSPAVEAVLDWSRQHPVLRYVAMDDVVVSKPGRLVVPPDARTLATSQSGPIIATVPAQGLQHLVVSFDVLRSNWPMQVSFPVFISNAVQWLAMGGRAGSGLRYQPGQIATVPAEDEAERVTFTGPQTLEANVTGGAAVLPMLEQVGVYRAQGNVPSPYDQLAVNLLSETESDLRPVERLAVGTSPVQAQSESLTIRKEVWPWFVWGALAFLLIEWLVYTRRMHL